MVQEYERVREPNTYVIQKCNGKYYYKPYEHACGRDFGNEKRHEDYRLEDERKL